VIDYLPIVRPNDDFQRPLSPEQTKAICCRVFGTDYSITGARELARALFNSTFVLERGGQTPRILRVAPDDKVPFAHEAFLLRRDYAVQPFLAPIAHFIPGVVMADILGL